MQPGRRVIQVLNSARSKQLILLALLSLAPQLYSHPHSWITLKSEFVLNKQNQITQIHQTWTFDTYYSLITIADMMNTHGDETLGLTLMAQDMASNLAEYGYFSHLEINDTLTELPMPEALLSIQGEKEKAILTLAMTFTLEQPRDIVNKRVLWSVYDPSYYISMSHESVEDFTISARGSVECGKDLILPNPTDDQIEYAGSLDKTEKNTQGLGELFAEVISIQCI